MALTAIDIQKVYLAFFSRSADVSGMNYWLNSEADTPRSWRGDGVWF
ncbi:MAG: DUF4214 domain-containing protein [Azonexus sp.]|jgi:hypothetical protein|nr:DUF4214 domain-containing protein [Azonexus sp.]